MSYFHSEISIPSNTNKKLRLDAHDSMERDYTFTFPAQTGENNSIMIIGEDQTASWTKDISINDISAVNFDISYVNAKFIDVSAMHANNINVANINATTIQAGTSVVTKTIVSDNVVSSNISTPNMISTNMISTNIESTEITTNNITASSNVNATNVTSNSISLGADSEITLTHAADTGLNVKNTNNADNRTAVVTLQNGKTAMQADDVIGAINFQSFGANLAAGIEAVAEAPPQSAGSTKLSFKTAGANEAATEKAFIRSSGGLVLKSQNHGTTSGLSITQSPSNIENNYHTWYMYANGNLNFSNANIPKGYLDKDSVNTKMNFTGQHRSIMNTNISESSVGLIVSSTGKFINTDNSLEVTINDSLPICIFSNSDNDKKVFGVLSDKEDSENTRSYSSGNWVSVYSKQNNNEQRVFINSLGEGAIWVSNKNGILENGDYISSSIVPGYGMKQSDDLLHNYTVAKITCDCDFSTTKIVKQKLKVIETTDFSGNTITEIDYDANGDVQYEDDLDKNGNQQMVYPLETRFLEENGSQITEEQYTDKLANGENVYIACFVGCTYHCG